MVARIIPAEQMPVQEYVNQVNAWEAYHLREDVSQIVERHIHNGYESRAALHEALWAAPPLAPQREYEPSAFQSWRHEENFRQAWKERRGVESPKQEQDHGQGYGR